MLAVGTLYGPAISSTNRLTLLFIIMSMLSCVGTAGAGPALRSKESVPVPPHALGVKGGLIVEHITHEEASAWNAAATASRARRSLPSSPGGHQCSPEVSFPPPDDGWALVEGILRTNIYAGDGDFSSDGGMFVVGQQSGTSPHFVVLYFDAAFNLVWGVKILAGGSAASNVAIQTASVVSGNTVTLTGFTNYNTQAGGDVFVAQLDVNGNVLWSTVFGSAGNDYGQSIAGTPDGGFIVGAWSSLYSSGANDGCIAKLDSAGNLQWVTSLAGTGVSEVGLMPDGSVLSVSNLGPNPDWTVYVSALNSTTGALVWSNSYSINLVNSVFNINGIGDPVAALSPDGGLLAVSFITLKTDINNGLGLSLVNLSTGNVTWTLLLSSTSLDQLYDVLWAPDGSLLFLGTTSSFGIGSSKDILLMRVLRDGTITYAVAIGGSLVDVGYALRIDTVQVDGLYIIGYTSSYGAGQINPVILYLDDYTIAPRQVGVLTVSNIRNSSWIPHPVVMNQTSLNVTAISKSESLAGPNLITFPSLSGTSLGSFSGLVSTWLTYPLLSESFPFVTAALVEFPWSYTLPSAVYQHLGNTPITLTISTDAPFVSVVPNSLSLAGTPILANVGTYTVNITATATIPYIGFTAFPAISVTLCVGASTPFSMKLLSLEKFVVNFGFEFSSFLVASTGQCVWVGASVFLLDGATDALVWAFSDSDLSEVQWYIQGIYGGLLATTVFQSSFNGIVEEEDGNFTVAGFSTEFSVGGSVDILLGRVSSAGAILWTSTIGGSGKDTATGIVHTPDGHTIVGGYTNSFGAGGYDALVIAIDPNSNGTLLWNFTYGSLGDEQLFSLIVLPSGSLLGVGYSTDVSGAGGQDCFLLQFTSAGSVTSARVFGSTGNDVINAAAVMGSGGIMFTGYSTSGSAGGSDVLVGSLSADGDAVMFASTYGGSAADVGSSICLYATGGVAVTGYTSSVGAGGKDILMSVYDSTGDVVWSTATGGPADDTGLQITQSHATSYLNVMSTASSFGVVPGAWLTTSSTGDLSPNFAGESIPSELTYRAWVNTPTANASDMTVSAMSGVTPYVYNYGTFHVGLQSSTPRFESTLQYFNLSALPSTVIQVPFAKAFSVNLYPCIAPEATFQAVSSVGSKTLPVWLEFNQVSGNLRGTPTGSVRGLYFVELTVVVLNQQSVSFALNVTNTAPFYDGPTVLSTGLGNFVFSLRDYIFDAEGDAVSNYQLAPYYPAGSSVPIEPNPIATVNSFTGQLEGGALSGSGGSYVYNLTMSDSFGAVGWTLVTLVIHQPSLIASFVEKLLPEMAAASILLAVLFALWRQDQAHTNTTRWLQKLAILYCQPNQEVVSSKLLRELFLVREEIVCLMSSSLDLAEFDPVAARVTVEQYCDRLVMLSMRDQTGCVSDEVTATLGAHKLINKIARIVQRRLEMGPPKVTINQYSTEFTTTFHMKTLFLMNCMNHILEAMLLSFGAQLTTVTLKSRVSFVGSLVDLVTAPFRFCLSLCSRREVPRPGEVSFALTHSIRQRLLADAVAIHSWTAGSWGSFRIPCVSRTDTLLALQLRHASARLYESILYLPDSASGLDLLLNSVKHVLAPGELLKDLTALIQVPSEWYTVYISTRLSLQALLNAPDRTSRLADLQRALHIHCFQPRRCGGGYDVIVSWQLLFGWVGLFTEVLMTMPSPLREEERLQLRGDSELGDADGPPMMTLRLLAELPGGSCVQVREAVLIRKAASDALELTSLPTSEPSSDSVQSRLTAGLSLWTFRPSPHLRVRHMSYRTGSTLLPVPKRAHLVPHSGSSQSQNRVHTESPVAGPSTATAARPASRWRTGLRSPSARILVDDYTGLHNVPLDEPVTLAPTEPNV